MSKKNVRISGALLLVLTSLVLASMACYSGQVPGVFELTPYHTQTPLPVDENARFNILETVLAPNEPGRAFFNLTLFAEPLDPSLVNSKAMCESDSPAQVLYAGIGTEGETYYLVDCTGSVGWVLESRLAGPLKFTKEDLAITIAPEGTDAVPVLDDNFQPPAFMLQPCKPETIVPVIEVKAADVNNDGNKNVFYRIECPKGNKGWVTNNDLFGPVEITDSDRALAVAASGEDTFRLAGEPAPVTDENAVEGECAPGAILQAQEAMLVNDNVYYKMTCGDIEGWVDQARFVGPLIYDVDDYTVIYIPSIPVFEDELPVDAITEVAEDTEEGAEEAEDVESPAETDVAAEGAEGGEGPQRAVVQYTPPLYLTEDPGPAVPSGEDANVAGQCVSNSVAHIQDFAGLETIYYRITCDECVESEVTEDGEMVCNAYETRDGWVEQQYLQGPLTFIVGDTTVFKASSKAVEADEDGTEFARIPENLAGAGSIGRFTEFSGRCPLDAEIDIIDIYPEKARTSNVFTFYYKVQCTGELATYENVTDDAGTVTPVVTYEAGSSETITGWILPGDLEPVER